MGESANPRPRPWRFGSDSVSRQRLAPSGLISACLAPLVTPAMAWTWRKPRESAARLVLACFPVCISSRGMNSQLEDETRGTSVQLILRFDKQGLSDFADSTRLLPPPSSTFKQWHRVNSKPDLCRCHPTLHELPLLPLLPSQPANPGYTTTFTPQACRPSPLSRFPRSPTSRTWVASSISMSVPRMTLTQHTATLRKRLPAAGRPDRRTRDPTEEGPIGGAHRCRWERGRLNPTSML